jgi:hypothetical protein
VEIKPGQKVKIFCDEGLTEAGTIEEYSDDQLVLRLIDKSIFVVNDPRKRIIAFKISNSEMKSSGVSDIHVDIELEPDHYHKDEVDRAATLGELRKQLAHEERKRASEHMNRTKVTESADLVMNQKEYGTPNLTKPIPKHPKKKA